MQAYKSPGVSGPYHPDILTSKKFCPSIVEGQCLRGEMDHIGAFMDRVSLNADVDERCADVCTLECRSADPETQLAHLVILH